VNSVLVLPAEITHAEAGACLTMLLRAARAEAEPLALVDATALTRFDSSALAVLLECRRECLHDGKGFAVRALPARLRELARLYGVAELLPDLA
jgi:phospholipid transport system transporter-binding protein